MIYELSLTFVYHVLCRSIQLYVLSLNTTIVQIQMTVTTIIALWSAAAFCLFSASLSCSLCLAASYLYNVQCIVHVVSGMVLVLVQCNDVHVVCGIVLVPVQCAMHCACSRQHCTCYLLETFPEVGRSLFIIAATLVSTLS